MREKKKKEKRQKNSERKKMDGKILQELTGREGRKERERE